MEKKGERGGGSGDGGREEGEGRMMEQEEEERERENRNGTMEEERGGGQIRSEFSLSSMTSLPGVEGTNPQRAQIKPETSSTTIGTT